MINHLSETSTDLLIDYINSLNHIDSIFSNNTLDDSSI